MPKCRGEAHPSSKMTADKVRSLRRLRKTVGFTYAQLGELFGITARSAWEIDKGFHWKHVKDGLEESA